MQLFIFVSTFHLFPLKHLHLIRDRFFQVYVLRKDDFDETKESGELISQKGGELDYKNLVSKLE